MEDSTSQKNIFLCGEGDAWYRRNVHIRSDKQEVPYDVECISAFCKSPAVQPVDRVLEIGCSDGMKLNLLCNDVGAVGYGIDPSTNAITDGKSRNPSHRIHLSVGTSDNIPYDDSFFDLVFFGFCLYLVDRDLLCQTMESVNRVLRPGGVLAITDFDVSENVVRDYHHFEGVKTYKCNYPMMFIERYGYHLAFKSSYSHFDSSYTDVLQERIAISIMHKQR